MGDGSEPGLNNGVGSPATLSSRRRRRNGRRTIRLVFAIVANFVAFWLPWNVFWLPWNVFSLVIELDRTIVLGSHFRIIDLGLKVFALAGSACVNPFFYCWFNENFRIELASLIASVPLGVIGQSHRRSAAGRRSGLNASPQDGRVGVANTVAPAALENKLSSEVIKQTRKASPEVHVTALQARKQPQCPVNVTPRSIRLEHRHSLSIGGSTTVTTGCALRDVSRSLNADVAELAQHETKL